MLFRANGDVSKKPYPADKAFRKLNEPVQFFLAKLLLTKPGIYLREIQFELETQLGVSVSLG